MDYQNFMQDVQALDFIDNQDTEKSGSVVAP